MPFPSSIGASISEVELSAMITSLDSVITTITGKAVINLTPEERQQGPSIDNTRLPYVQQAIQQLAPSHPTLVPGFQDVAEAERNMNCALACRELVTKLNQTMEVVTDFAIANERLAYQFTLDFYLNAKRADERNVPGAGTPVEELKPLFDRESNPETPPAP
ncbi:MAG: hypothetical protein KIS94_12500 [Chitinophagales bacterium]|nr:hypothetical protein [Chitinophagales bacterium]